jgi:hypothetical protein
MTRRPSLINGTGACLGSLCPSLTHEAFLILIYGAAIRNHRKRLKTWHRDPLRSTVNGGDRKADSPGTQTPPNTFSNCVPAKCVKLEGQFNLGDIHDTRLHGAV